MITSFGKYKELKSQLEFSYRGFVMGRILSIRCWDWANNNRLPLSNLRLFFKRKDLSFLVSSIKGKKNAIFSDIGRKDHKGTFLNIADKVKGEYCIVGHFDSYRVDNCFDLRALSIAFSLVFKNVHHVNVVKKMCIAAVVCMYINTINELLKLEIQSLKRFVVFSAVHETQNLLAQYFKLKGSQVMGLTHGAQFVYEKNIPRDAINYENLHIDCLVWGEMTKDEYVKFGIDDKTLFVAGYPKKIDVKGVNSKPWKNSCIVFLCRPAFDESNMRLMKVLAHFTNDYSFSLKLHPDCDYVKYEGVCKDNNMKLLPKSMSLSDCMDSSLYSFAIAVNTTTYYEIQLAGIPCLRYDDGDSYDLMKGLDNDRFSNTEELSKSIDWIRHIIDNNEYDELRDSSLKYNIGLGIDRYREFLLK